MSCTVNACAFDFSAFEESSRFYARARAYPVHDRRFVTVFSCLILCLHIVTWFSQLLRLVRRGSRDVGVSVGNAAEFCLFVSPGANRSVLELSGFRWSLKAAFNFAAMLSTAHAHLGSTDVRFFPGFVRLAAVQTSC